MYVITNPTPESEDPLNPGTNEQTEEMLAEYDQAAGAMFHNTKNVDESIRAATDNGLIRGYDDIMRLNAMQRRDNFEDGQGRHTLSNGNPYLHEARGSLAIHLTLERDPRYGPNWWKDDDKFDRYCREFPGVRLQPRRQSVG